jgi:hypothetical protein
MSVSVDLSRKQLNALHKGKTIVLKSSQMNNGSHSLLLNDAELRRYRSAVRNNKGMKITVNNLDGSGFKDVMKSVKKGVSKAVKVAKPIAKELRLLGEVAKPIAKDVARELLKENRPAIDKAMKKRREITERKAEDLLMSFGMPKDLAQDLITDNSMKLSKKASNQLDKLEGKVDKVMGVDMGMVKGKDYDVKNYEDLPVAVAQQIPTTEAYDMTMLGQSPYTPSAMKGGRVVYLKGSGAKKFLRGLKKVASSVLKNKTTKKILTELGKQGVSALITGMTGSPVAGQMVSQATGNLVEKGIDAGADATADAIGGSGILTRPKTEMRGVSKMGGALYIPRGAGVSAGALYAPSARRTTGKGLVGPEQGGRYYI